MQANKVAIKITSCLIMAFSLSSCLFSSNDSSYSPTSTYTSYPNIPNETGDITAKSTIGFYSDPNFQTKMEKDGQNVIKGLSARKSFYLKFHVSQTENTYSSEKSVNFSLAIDNVSGFTFGFLGSTSENLTATPIIKNQNSGYTTSISNLTLVIKTGKTQYGVNDANFCFSIKTGNGLTEGEQKSANIQASYSYDLITKEGETFRALFDNLAVTQQLNFSNNDITLDKQNGIISWPVVDYADNYQLQENDSSNLLLIPSECTTYTINRKKYAGKEEKLLLRAVSDSVLYRDSEPATIDFQVLSSPTLSLEKNIDETYKETFNLNFGASTTGDGFGLTLDGSKIDQVTSSSEYDLAKLFSASNTGTHQLAAFSRSNKNNIVDSLPSDPITLNALKAPIIEQNGIYMDWEAVLGATTYLIYYDNVLKETTSSTQWRIKAGYGSKITVYAISNDSYTIKSQASNVLVNTIN
ncbi:MAG: hypothetical protein LKM30_04210 [Bacilli bacterium]|jgi:hypothetical protein|nr:hypothetical protein [Bacilli bacterium]